MESNTPQQPVVVGQNRHSGETQPSGQLRVLTHKQSLSWQGRVLRPIFWVRRAARKMTASNQPDEIYVAKKRVSGDKTAQRFKPISPIRCEQVAVDRIAAEWITPADADPPNPAKPTILYLHGGSYTGGSIVSHRPLAGSIACLAQARALLFNYRLAPEHPFPAALDDARTAYQWLLNNSVEPRKIVVVGDSAGGGLALALLTILRDNGMHLPAAAVCISPWTDLECAGDSWDANADHDVLLDPVLLRRSAKMYLNGVDPHTPLASPLYADLRGLPPLFIQAGTREILLSDSTRLAHSAHDAGVDVTLDLWDGMVHGWHYAVSLLPEARAAIDNIREFVSFHTTQEK